MTYRSCEGKKWHMFGVARTDKLHRAGLLAGQGEGGGLSHQKILEKLPFLFA
jgi:hypothetical protein